jgi:hypothetical protein
MAIEVQRGDQAFAGQVMITYSDITSDADAECDIFFDRELSNEEVEELLEAAASLLCGQGTITVYTGHEIVSEEFSLIDDGEELDDEE